MNTENDAPHCAIFVGPNPNERIASAIEQGGGRLVDDPQQARAIVWLDPSDRDGLGEALHDEITWVQLPAAGVESWVDWVAGDTGRLYTSAQGAYAVTVAEHALALLLAGARHLHENARARSWSDREERRGEALRSQEVLIVGCGSIGEALIPMLASLEVPVLAVTRSGRVVPSAAASFALDDLDAQLWARAAYILLAAPLTPQSRRLVDDRALMSMREDAWLVNVGRGELIDTDALLRALSGGHIRGAALDVTDPEPLPDGHPLWDHPRALITPHSANPRPSLEFRLAERVEENVRRFCLQKTLLGMIDPERGY